MNKNKRRKESKQYKMSHYDVLQGVKVIVKPHAIKRFRERNPEYRSSSDEVIKEVICYQVHKSKLVGYNYEKGEHRLFSHRIFVVKSGYENGEMVCYVVTVLQTKTRHCRMAS